VAPSRIVGVSASVNLLLHHKVQKFSSGTVSPGWSRKKAVVVVVLLLLGNPLLYVATQITAMDPNTNHKPSNLNPNCTDPTNPNLFSYIKDDLYYYYYH